MSTDRTEATSDLEHSLDPVDWDEFRAIAHDVLNACLDRLQNARDLPWTPPNQSTLMHRRPLPESGRGWRDVAQSLTQDIMPYATGNTHPRFFGWVHGTGLPSGLLAEMVSAAMNSNCGGRDHGAVYVERCVIDWCTQIFNLPSTAGGLLTSGTSYATLLALAAARTRVLGIDIRKRGMRGASNVAVYAGSSAHNCAAKALELMGIGSDAIHCIPTIGASGPMDVSALRAAISEDRARGRTPMCVIGTAGSVDSGAFDDLNALADVCEDEQLWFHVDGAFGAWVVLADDPWSQLASGVDRADSIAFDFHKWMYVQYDVGAVLVRDAAHLYSTFSDRPAYLQGETQGLAGGEPWFCDYGIELSRGFRALKVWTALESHGLQAMGRKVTDNCRQAAELARLVAAQPNLVLAAPVSSNICCFRVRAGTLSEERQDALHRDIAVRLQLRGQAVLSTTTIDHRTVLRAAIVNHRTTMEDIRATVAAVHAAVKDLRD